MVGGVNNTYSSGGESVEVVNTNLSSSILPTVITYQGGASGDLVVDNSDELEIGGIFIGANVPFQSNQDGSIVVTYKKSLCFKATGVAGNKIKVTLSFALHDAGEKL